MDDSQGLTDGVGVGVTQRWLIALCSPNSIFKQMLRAALPALPSPPCKYTLFLIVLGGGGSQMSLGF